MKTSAKKIVVLIVLVLIILFGVGQFFAYSNLPAATPNSGSSTSTEQTAVISYVPAIDPSLPVQNGSCWTNSIAAPYRSDAWRCTVGNAISDPCFVVASTTNELLCDPTPASTATTSSFVLKLITPLPKASSTPNSTPSNWAWLLELADGTICSPFTGTRPFSTGGVVATYGCNGPSSTESLVFGDLNNSGQLWTAEVGALSNSTSTFPPPVTASSVVPVAVVWQ